MVPVLAKVFAKGEPPIVDQALLALATMGDAATPALIEALKRPEARWRAASVLAHIGAPAKSAVPGLVGALDDKNPDVRREILHALASIGPDSASAHAVMTSALEDPDLRVAAMAAYALGRLGQGAKSSVPALRRSLESTDPVLRVSSAWALAHITPTPETARLAVPVLMQGLKNENVAVRRGAADALGEFRCRSTLGRATAARRRPRFRRLGSQGRRRRARKDRRDHHHRSQAVC